MTSRLLCDLTLLKYENGSISMIRHVLRRGILKLLAQAFCSQLRRNVTSGVVVVVVNAVALGVSYPLYLYFLGYEVYGLWLVLATVLGFAQLGMLGIPQAVMKLVAEEYALGSLRGIQSYVAMALTILAATGTFVLVMILLFKNHIVGVFKLSERNSELVCWLLPYVCLLSVYVFLIQVLGATLSGMGRMDLANYIRATGRIVSVGISVLLLCFGGGVESLLIASALSYVFVHVASLIFIHRQAEVYFLRRGHWDWGRLKKLLGFGTGVFGGSLMRMLLDPFNKLVLARYAGVAVVPVYDIAYKGSMQVRAFVEAALRAIMPEVSRLGATKDGVASNRILKIYKYSVKLVLFAGVPVFILGILVISYTPVLKLWLGSKFVGELPAAVSVMLFGTFLGLLGVPAYYTLIGLGRVRKTFIAHTVVSGMNAGILITVVLIGCAKLSVSMVAWAFVAGTGVSTVYLLWEKGRSLREAPLLDETTEGLSVQNGPSGNDT